MKQTIKKKQEKIEIVRRTGNVFAQLKRPEADDLLRKSRVLSVITDVLGEMNLDQAAAAEKLGIDQADVSRLVHGKLSRFSLDRLMTLVDRLGASINLCQTRDAGGNLIVTVEPLAHA